LIKQLRTVNPLKKKNTLDNIPRNVNIFLGMFFGVS
jgi:hypothetical protein